MLLNLMALGAFDAPGGGTLLPAPADRRTTLSRTTGYTIAGASIDPYEVQNFELDMSALLEPDETFDSVAIQVTTVAAALGFSIPTAGEYAPVERDDSHLVFWPMVDPAVSEAGGWSNDGQLCGFEITMRTNSTPPRTWQRTALIRVKQK